MIIKHNRTNYNVSLIDALHSVFWYQGLLEQEGDEWIDFPAKDGDKYGFKRPKYDDNCVILRLIDALRHKQTKYPDMYTTEDVKEICPDFLSGKQYNVIWMMLVEMFGSCGTSPRTGWIEQRQECANFLQLVVECEEWLYYNG